MTRVRRVRAPEIRVCGKSVFITGQDNAQFAAFWDECQKNGVIERLTKIFCRNAATVTNSRVFGVSRVEKDPGNRAFYFYIVAECGSEPVDGDFDVFTIPACEWAVFENEGELPMCLVDSEIYAMTKWLPESGEEHAMMPELEVYPNVKCASGVKTEFWLPLKKL